MVETIRLFDEDPYITEFDGTVVTCEPCDKGYDVVLDQTQFFPEQGGQSYDCGTLGGLEIKDVQIKSNVIHHYVESPLSGKVHGVIDFEKRYDRMQNHSGEHCFSGIAHTLYGVTNVGFRLADDIMTVDFDKMLSDEEITLIENKVNKAITDNLPIICSYPENVEEIEYRSKKELDGAIRIVEIPGVDICACCAPHVHSTGEVGIFKILRYEKHKSGIRFYIACGKRALLDYQLKQNEIAKISAMVSLPPYEVSNGVQKLLDDMNELRATISKMKKQMIAAKLDTLANAPSIYLKEEMESNVQNEAVKMLLNKVENNAGIFCVNGNGYRFMIASKSNDAQNVLNKIKESYPVKGGGKPDMVQGTIPNLSESELDALLASL